MEAPISASQGAMRSLPGKLDSLLSEASMYGLHKGGKSKIRLLRGELQDLIDKYLMEPSDVESPALTAICWAKEVREMSYDINDFVDELVDAAAGAKIGIGDVKKTPHFKISRFREKLKIRQGIASEISGFRARVKQAIHRHNSYLGNCKLRPHSSAVDERPPPPLYGEAGRLRLDKSSVGELYGWLTNDGQPKRKVVSIVGAAGVGKTTLANELYRKLGGQFQCRAFVRTSPRTGMKKILSSIFAQVRRHQPPKAGEMNNLVGEINAYLKDKTYFIIIDDLCASSTWDIINRALPENDCCSRILTTTEVEIVAHTCCADNSNHMPSEKEDNSKYIFKKEPLSEDESRELFSSIAFGHESECPEHLEEVQNEIIKRIVGLPLAIITTASVLACHPASTEQWNYIKNTLSSNLITNANPERIKEVLNLGYNCLPHHLKACMLYLSVYEEDYIIWKDDLVNQWIAEGFICAMEGNAREELARSYFDELVNRGLIQPVDINCNDEVLSCTVHHMVLHLIRYKSIEENFMTAIDHTQTAIQLADKVRRLSLHFSNAEHAIRPANLRLSQVRSLSIFGLYKRIPSIVEFKLLQVLILQLWVEHGDVSYDLTEISGLFRLRCLHINACHLQVILPRQMRQLKVLETLKIEAKVTAVPSDIVDLARVSYLSLPSEANLATGIGRMTSLRTLGYFDLGSKSEDNVKDLGKLTDLQDLHLTCSTVQPADNLENNMKCLGLILGKLSSLKCLTLVPAAGSSHVNSLQDDAGASSMSISSDALSMVSPPRSLLQRLEVSWRCCIFSSLPKWVGELSNLCILKIAVRNLSREDTNILKRLPALTALSLYIQTAPADRIVIEDKEGFPVLTYFKFVCTAPCLSFMEGAMPNVRKLKLGFNANRMKPNSLVVAGLKCLTGLREISLKLGGAGADDSDRTAAESALQAALSLHPKTLISRVQCVDVIFDDKKDKSTVTQGHEQLTLGMHQEIEESKMEHPSEDVNEEIDHGRGQCADVIFDEEDKSTVRKRQEQLTLGMHQEIEESKIEHPSEDVNEEIDCGAQCVGVIFDEEDKSTVTKGQEQLSLGMHQEMKESKMEHPRENVHEEIGSGVQCVDVIFDKEGKSTVTKGQEQLTPGMHQEIKESKMEHLSEDVHEEIGSGVQCVDVIFDEDDKITVTKGQEQDDEITVTLGMQREIKESKTKHPSEDVNKKINSGISTKPESSSHLQNLESEKRGGAMEVTVTAWAMSPLLRKLPELLSSEYNLKKRMKKGIEYLLSELRWMHAALLGMGEGPDQLDEVRIWAGKVRDLSYDMEDVVDVFMVRVEERDSEHINMKNRVKKFHKKITKLFSKGKALHQIPDSIQEAQDRVKELAKQYHRCMIEIEGNRYKIEKQSTSVGDNIDPRLITIYKDVTELVGIDEPRDELIQKLIEGDEGSKLQLKTVSIVGFGGLGKTTLAKAVYDKMKVQFDCGAFVSVSQPLDKTKVLNDVMYELDKDKFGDIRNTTSDVLWLIGELHKFLEDKRYLIVFDDIWDESAWKFIMCALPENSLGSRLITTTRIVSVAEACRSSNDHMIHAMKPLSNEDSRRLFNRRIFHIEMGCPDQLQEVSKGILKKCGGLPLAIIAIASLLVSNKGVKPKEQWCRVLKSMGHGLLEGAIVEDMRRILLFSYYDLPSPLKACLLYLSIFPEDYEIERERLIWRWIAEGFIHPGKQEAHLFEVGESYFKELTNRSMIIPVDIDCEDKARACRVHDMMLDLICSLSSEKNYVTILHGVGPSISDSQSKVHRISLQNNSMAELNIIHQLGTRSMSEVRSVSLFMSAVDVMPSLSRFKVLRVLDLEGCDLSERQDKIHLRYLGNLLHLRYLGLRFTRIGHLPSEIGKLKFLQTLDIRRTEIKELPSSVVGLRRLMRLCIDSDTKVSSIGLGNLVSLEELIVLDVDHFCQDDFEELSNLTELRVLRISFSGLNESKGKALTKSIGNMHRLQILEFDSDVGRNNFMPEGSVPPPQLGRFTTGYKYFPTLPKWINPSSLPLLSHLQIWVDEARWEDIQILGTLPALRYLHLVVFGSMEELAVDRGFVITADAFPCLRKCRFIGSIRVLPSMFPPGAMPMLRYLFFPSEARVMAIGGLDLSMGHLPSLERVEVELWHSGASDEEVEAAKASLRQAADAHPNRPTLDLFMPL